MSILKIKKYVDGVETFVDIADPIELQWEISDIEGNSTGRSQEGNLFRDRVTVKRKLSCKWGPMNEVAMADLLDAVKGVSFELEYPDALTGTRLNGTFYVGDRSTPMYRAMSDGTWLWYELGMSFMEM